MKTIYARFKHNPDAPVLVDDNDYERLNQFRWRINSDGYACRSYGNGIALSIFMHHEVIGQGSRGIDVDHIDRNKLNNQSSNLRFVSRSTNRQNSSIVTSRTGYRGVYERNNRFMAQIRLNYKLTSLGMFDTKEEAARAYDTKALELYGKDARLNFPS